MKKLLIHSPKHGTHTVLYDDEDHELISKYHWYPHKGSKHLYVQSSVYKNGKRIATIKMHRLVMGFPKKQIDHRNRNSLDNRKSNLRFADNSQNQMNRGPDKNNTTGYKGVSFKKREGKFVARITVKSLKKRIFLGHFLTARRAAKAYNKAALEYFGEFAYLNKL